MIKSIMKYFAKKYALQMINDGIAALQEKRDLKPYKDKALAIANFASRLMLFLEDNKIDKQELEQLQESVKDIF